eukprot:4643229-Amphidinium_carterae.1
MEKPEFRWTNVIKPPSPLRLGVHNASATTSKALLWNCKSVYLSVPASPRVVSGPTSKVRQFQVPMRIASDSMAFSSGTSGGSLRPC